MEIVPALTFLSYSLLMHFLCHVQKFKDDGDVPNKKRRSESHVPDNSPAPLMTLSPNEHLPNSQGTTSTPSNQQATPGAPAPAPVSVGPPLAQMTGGASVSHTEIVKTPVLPFGENAAVATGTMISTS